MYGWTKLVSCRPIWTSGVACGVLSSAIMAANALLVKLVSDEVPVFQIVVSTSPELFESEGIVTQDLSTIANQHANGLGSTGFSFLFH